jgi:hypothetical protein
MKQNEIISSDDYRRKRIDALENAELERDEILRRRIMDPTERKRFRNAYAFKVGADYGTLFPFCENIIVATEGYADHIDITRAKLELALKDYDSDKDVLVGIGRSLDNLIVGMLVVQKILQKPPSRQSYAIAVYYNFSYRFYEIFLDAAIAAHEIYTK